MDAPDREITLTEAWLKSAQRLPDLRDDRGRRLEVIYAGHESGGPGPDIQDAIVSFDGGPGEHGDIEVHLDSKDWRRHGHAADPAYEGVILHVVWAGPGEGYAGPPAVALRGRLGEGVEPVEPGRTAGEEGWPCEEALGKAPPAEALQVLHWQGWQRLVERSNRFESDLAVMTPDEALYRGVLEALGYSQNREPFRRLAEILPWDSLGRLLDGREGRLRLAEALLFGEAGLLPETVVGGEMGKEEATKVGELLALWKPLKIAPMRRSDWRFHGVRPNNWPTRRLAAASRLFAEVLTPPPTVALQKAVVEVAETGSSVALEELFRVPIEEDDFWSGRLDFGRPASARATALVGTARAREILANVALPLSLCIARRQANAVLLEGVREAFVTMGSVAPNRITRYMAEITTTDYGWAGEGEVGGGAAGIFASVQKLVSAQALLGVPGGGVHGESGSGGSDRAPPLRPWA